MDLQEALKYGRRRRRLRRGGVWESAQSRATDLGLRNSLLLITYIEHAGHGDQSVHNPKKRMAALKTAEKRLSSAARKHGGQSKIGRQAAMKAGEIGGKIAGIKAHAKIAKLSKPSRIKMAKSRLRQALTSVFSRNPGLASQIGNKLVSL